MNAPTIGVLALQGDVREHERALSAEGAQVRRVRRPVELEGLDGLVVPGGESTAIEHLARGAGLFDPLRGLVSEGLPVFGTCAGMVLLAQRLEDAKPGQQTLGGVDMTVRRNGFGRQVDSFEEDLLIDGLMEPVTGVFIRAPWVVEVGPGVEVLAHSFAAPGNASAASGADPAGAAGAGGRIVAVRQGVLMATSFHPEVGGDSRLHRLFLDRVRCA